MSSTVQIAVVTGAGGFVGTEVAKQLLANGYTVRATVRKIGSPQYEHLKMFSEALAGNLEFYEADLTEPGSFDKPIEGATFVFHTASPVDFGSGEPDKDQEEIVDPAVHGTATVIKSAGKHKSVKRVVITSSIAAVTPSNQPIPKGKVYTDQSWNTYDTVETNAYYQSKTAAEKEAWQLAEELGVDMVTIHPSLVIGPLSSARSGLSADIAKKILEDGSLDSVPEIRNIDVRDVAEAHILAAELPSAKGRYLLSQPYTTNMKDVSDALQAAFPDWGIASAESKAPVPIFDISKVERELGLRLRSIPKAFVDAARTTIQLKLAHKKVTS